MFKGTILLLLITLSIFPTAYAKPKNIPTKIAEGVVQLLNRHPYLSTAVMIPSAQRYIQKNIIEMPINYQHPTAFMLALASWVVAAQVFKTATTIVMNICDIDRIKD